MGQMIGLILMEMIFSLSFAQPSGGSGFTLNTVPIGEMMHGFSWAYVGGAGLCLLAIFFSLFIREKGATVSMVEGAACLH